MHFKHLQCKSSQIPMTYRQVGANICRHGSLAIKKFQSSRHVYQLFDGIPHSYQAGLAPHAFNKFKSLLVSGDLASIDEVTVVQTLKMCCGDPIQGSQIQKFALVSGLTSFVMVSNSLMNMFSKSGQYGNVLSVFESLENSDTVSWNTVLSGIQSSGEALGFVVRMNFEGVAFDAYSYTTALSFCMDDHGFLLGLQLHSQLRKGGFGGDVFVGNALITLYSRWRRMVEAKKVFDEMPNRDLISWNAILSGYSQEGSYGAEAMLVFIDMLRNRMELDHVSLSSAVSACGHERNLRLGRLVHGLSIKEDYATHASVCNILMSLYLKCEQADDVKLVFERMDGHDVVSWTTMITADELQAVCLFNRMRLLGVYPNEVTYVALIHAISSLNLVQEGRTVHGLCLKLNHSSKIHVCNSLITMYMKFEAIQDSVMVFQELDCREIISWNALVSGYAQNGMWLKALTIFINAIVECKPNEYTFGSVLNAIASAKDMSLKQGQMCHCHAVKVGLNFNPIVSSALLDMYAKRGSIHESERVFRETPLRSQISWTSIISAHASHGDYDRVIYWFKEMEREGTVPDSITFLSMLTACGRKGMVDRGRELFNSMIKDYQIEPSQEHFACMVDMLGRAGRLEEAEELMHQIPAGPGLSVLQSLLGACRIHGNVEMGERVSNIVLEMEPTVSGSYTLMSNLYAEKGMWEEVAKLRRLMKERGVKKEVGFSWVDVRDFHGSLVSHPFSSGDKTHPQYEKIYRMAEEVGAEMKFLRLKPEQEVVAL